MRILFVGTRRSGGGAESHLVQMASALDGIGHDVAVVANREGFIYNACTERPNIELHHAEFRYASDLRGTRDLIRIARAFKPEWMVASQAQEYYSTAAAARVVGAKVVFFEHTDLPRRGLTNFALPRIAHRFIVPSNYLRTHLIRRGMPEERIQVLHNPVDVDVLHPDGAVREAMREHLGFKPDDFVVGFVGRIEEAKGCHILAQSIRNARSKGLRVRGLWVGELRDGAKNDKDVYTGWVNDVAPYYQAMDVLALPTVKAETFGRVCIEAQAVGVPVIGSDLGGIPETMLAGQTGLLIRPGSVEDWTKAIIMMANEKNRHEMAASTIQFVADRFSSRSIARQFVNLLQTP